MSPLIAMICAYADHNEQPAGSSGNVHCQGPVVFTAHDKRGCRHVCCAHVVWLMHHSFIQGHSANCSEAE